MEKGFVGQLASWWLYKGESLADRRERYE